MIATRTPSAGTSSIRLDVEAHRLVELARLGDRADGDADVVDFADHAIRSSVGPGRAVLLGERRLLAPLFSRALEHAANRRSATR